MEGPRLPSGGNEHWHACRSARRMTAVIGLLANGSFAPHVWILPGVRSAGQRRGRGP